MLNKTKIICTIGSQSESSQTLEEMLLAGMNVARLNMSQGGIATQQRYIDTLKKLALIHDRTLSIMLDTYGPKVRTHSFENQYESIAKGCKVTIHTKEEIVGTNSEFSINYDGLFDDVKLNDEILLNEGSVHLLVIEKNEENRTIICEAMHSGQVKDYCLVNTPTIEQRLETISHDDASLLSFACKVDIDFIAASFIRNSEDVRKIKEYLRYSLPLRWGRSMSTAEVEETGSAVRNLSISTRAKAG